MTQSELVKIKELLSTGTGTEGSLLIPKKIFDTLIGEVGKNLIPRSEAALFIGPAQIPGSSVDINRMVEQSMNVREVAEGAEIPLDEAEYNNLNIKPKKYGVAIRITKELMEDSQFPLLQRNIQLAGQRLAENENSRILLAINGASNVVAGGAAITINNIARAIQHLEDNDYSGTSLLVGPEIAHDLRLIDTFVEADKAGNTQMMSTGFIGTIYGMNVIRFSANAAPATTYTTTAWVLDNRHAYVIAEKRAITVENFELPTFDMRGSAITHRFESAILRDNAVAKITTS
jgi:HK97 family phage major capsid protein|tara:strand:+ start:3783 stop:4649 length:867 start_codon:yes stop_codon:yes gene_type:complete